MEKTYKERVAEMELETLPGSVVHRELNLPAFSVRSWRTLPRWEPGRQSSGPLGRSAAKLYWGLPTTRKTNEDSDLYHHAPGRDRGPGDREPGDRRGR